MKKNSWIPFLSGALIGAGLAWLFTSKEGKEVVDKVVSKGKDMKDKLKEELNELQDYINQHNKTV